MRVSRTGGGFTWEVIGTGESENLGCKSAGWRRVEKGRRLGEKQEG